MLSGSGEKRGAVASIQTLELEARLADLEGGYGETLYQLHRESVRNKLGMTRMLAHLGLGAVSDDEVDAELDEH